MGLKATYHNGQRLVRAVGLDLQQLGMEGRLHLLVNPNGNKVAAVAYFGVLSAGTPDKMKARVRFD